MSHIIESAVDLYYVCVHMCGYSMPCKQCRTWIEWIFLALGCSATWCWILQVKFCSLKWNITRSLVCSTALEVRKNEVEWGMLGKLWAHYRLWLKQHGQKERSFVELGQRACASCANAACPPSHWPVLSEETVKQKASCFGARRRVAMLSLVTRAYFSCADMAISHFLGQLVQKKNPSCSDKTPTAMCVFSN